MKELYIKSLFFILFFLPLLASASKPVSYVDIKLFKGLWYEVARTYNSYEKDCVAPTVEYILKDNNSYIVFNRCFKNKIGGEIIEYKGSAKPTFNSSISEINMTYFYIFTRLYYVIYLEKDYSVAVVADKEMKNVWIMSRNPTMDKRKLSMVLAMLDKTMDIKKLILSVQNQKGQHK